MQRVREHPPFPSNQLKRRRRWRRRRNGKRPNFSAAWQMILFLRVTGVIIAAAVGVVMSFSRCHGDHMQITPFSVLLFSFFLFARVQLAPLIIGTRYFAAKQQVLRCDVNPSHSSISGSEIAGVIIRLLTLHHQTVLCFFTAESSASATSSFYCGIKGQSRSVEAVKEDMTSSL